jgi:pilus assembly protein CpaC
MKLRFVIAAVVIIFSLEMAIQAQAPAEPQLTTQAASTAPGGEETLRVYVGRSMVLRLPEALKRVSVTDPSVADALIVAPDQIVIHGLKPGTITLLLWDDQENLRSFDLQILQDIRSIAANLKQVFPGEELSVSESGSTLILTGLVSSQEVADRAAALVQSKSVTVANMLRTKPKPRNIVSLQVRFAEVDRSAVQQLGVNILSTGATNTLGSTSTQQFGETTASVGALPANVQSSGGGSGTNKVTGAIGNTLQNSPAVFGLSDLLNIFVFRPDLNLGVLIRALQQKNLVQILAEPNLLAVNGQEASFLAGGEFPFPVVQGGSSSSAVTVQFKEFGVKLKFLANIQENGDIRLKVSPEVSSLDYANGLTLGGFSVPGLSTRRADTEVDLRNGQSFAISGLIDNRLTEVASKIPWIGDVPILGNLFKSRAINRNKTELMVLVTPKLVKPIEPETTLPELKQPLPFLDDKKTDGKTEKSR